MRKEKEVSMPFDKNAVDAAFNSIVSECKGLSGYDLCKEVYARSFRYLTIRQTATVTGLSPVYIRRRTQEGKWSKDYDGSGRVIIPTYEILQYLEEKSHRVGIAYIVYLLPEEEARFKAAFPGKELKPRYDAKKAKAYRRRKKAERERGGVAQGTYRGCKNYQLF